jgi:WD40 repeat protein
LEYRNRKNDPTITGQNYSTNSVAFSPDGEYALSGNSDKTLKFWKVDTGVCLRTFLGHTGSVTSIACNPDGRQVITGSEDRTLRLWNLGNIGEFQAPFVLAVPVSGEAAIEHDQVFRDKIDQARLALERQDISRAQDLIRQARSMPNFEQAETAIKLWFGLYRYTRTGKLRGGWKEKDLGQLSGVRSMAFSPDGQSILTTNYHHLTLWDVKTRTCLEKRFSWHKDDVHAVAISPNGLNALTGSQDKTMKLWEIATGKCLATFAGHEGTIHFVSFSPDGRFAISGSKDSTLRIWDLASGACLRTLKARQKILSADISPDGWYIIAGSDYCGFKLWDFATGECLRTFNQYKEFIKSIAFSPDGRYIITGSGQTGVGFDSSLEYSVRRWELSSGNCVNSYKGHQYDVTGLAFSPDGRQIVSGSGLNVRLWNADTEECLANFAGHEKYIASIAFSPGGEYILSGGYDTLLLWALDWELEDYQPSDWDESARSYLDQFLTLHTPYAAPLPQGRQPTEEEVTLALTRLGKPHWSEVDFQGLLHTLGCRGYGWLRPEGVRKKLEELAIERSKPG